MNNEPVVWILGGHLDSAKKMIHLCRVAPTQVDEGYVPLYTHPVKELSRMDVYGLAIESGFMLSTQYGEAEHKLMPVSDGDTLVKLANAILRKAKE